ncbi:hypothetical protein [Deinococcus aestuarii]|uniref:hypothetical protein n=1 Tax=Deinococcus aestuarii TaxID=2774531 RepID=UPI001C0B3701|nr:hypothetical protein [Deinococcus aestuarii]
MAENAQALRQAQVNVPFQARRSKGRVVQDSPYRVTSFTLFASREACDLCDRPHQAERQVRIDTGDGEVRAGLTCLRQVSGITERRMEKLAEGQAGIALRVHRLVGGTFEDTREMIERLRAGAEYLLAGTRHGEQILQDLAGIQHRAGQAAIGDGDVERLRQLTDYLVLLQDARAHPEFHRARVQALLEDPAPGASAHTADLARLPLTTPEALTVDDVQRLRRAMREVGRLQLPARHTPEVNPEDHPSREAYQEALGQHYTRMVRAGQPLGSTLQGQYDLVHFDSWGRRVALDDLVGMLKLPCVVPVYDHPALQRPELQLDGAQALRLLERRTGQAMRERFCASGTRRLVEIRRDHPDRRADDRGRERPARPEDRVPVPCWFVGFWLEDPWSPVFPLWQAHGGRAALLAFPLAEEASSSGASRRHRH